MIGRRTIIVQINKSFQREIYNKNYNRSTASKSHFTSHNHNISLYHRVVRVFIFKNIFPKITTHVLTPLSHRVASSNSFTSNTRLNFHLISLHPYPYTTVCISISQHNNQLAPHVTIIHNTCQHQQYRCYHNI